MISSKFTVLELTDLALKVPEKGAVNFNILHSVLVYIIQELSLENTKITCSIDDETHAQVAITKARLEGRSLRRPSKIPTPQEVEKRLKQLKGDSEIQEEEPDVIDTAWDSYHEEEEDQVMGASEAKESDEKVSVREVETELDEDVVTDHREKSTDAEDQLTADDVIAPEEEKEESPDHSSDEQVAMCEGATAEDQEGTDEADAHSEVMEEGKEVGFAESSAEEMTIAEIQDTARDLLDEGLEMINESVAIVTDTDLLEGEPAQIMQEVWRATNINRRMEAAEKHLAQLSEIADNLLSIVLELQEQMDDVIGQCKDLLAQSSDFPRKTAELEEYCKTLAQRIEDSNEKRTFEVARLEDIIKEMEKDNRETMSALQELESAQSNLTEMVAYQKDLEGLKSKLTNVLERRMKAMTEEIREVEGTLVKKKDFVELTNHVEAMEERKVSRDDLGQLLKPGFVEDFLDKQENLRTEFDELKEEVGVAHEEFTELRTRIDEDIVKTMEQKFAVVHGNLDKVNGELSLLDADKINDSFVDLEEQADVTTKEMEEMKISIEKFQKEARVNFNKMSNFQNTITRIDQAKADKTKVEEQLETKADASMLLAKVDRSEMESVVGNMNETVKMMNSKVTIIEEKLVANISRIDEELSLQMYREDFVIMTQPMRNRLKAIIYEQRVLKRMFRIHLFPDAPGVSKCISCKRGANLAGLAPESNSATGGCQNGIKCRLPPLAYSDIDIVPEVPSDYVRQKDPRMVDVILAKARPHPAKIGLSHDKRKVDIDKEIWDYLRVGPQRPCGGKHTLTEPQQRGLKEFTEVKLPQVKMEQVFLQGKDNRIYKGTEYKQQLDALCAKSVAPVEEAAVESRNVVDDLKRIESKFKLPSLKQVFTDRR